MPPQFTFQLAAHSYFRSYENYFWQWEDQGAIIGIPNGRTIAYTPFVAETLGYLKDQGLPRFGTLLLAILATSRNPEADITNIIANLKKNFPGLSPLHLGAIEAGGKFLHELAKLPPAYKEGKRRWMALQTIFQSLQHPIRHFFADDIVNLISRKRVDKDVLLRKEIIDHKTIYSDFHPFIHLCEKFPDAAAIIMAMGELPEVEEELPIPEETPEPEIDFMQELQQNPETAEIAALLPLIWSALEIPRHNRLPGRQPMGGVAGLTNKGEAHRLLASEFANDDLIFLSRLANNEALYLNRETPPQSDDRERVLLVDVSLKNWGTPHTIAFALMLAIARHPKSLIPCSAFAVHESWQALRFDDIHQVIDSLLVLEPCLHPAAGIDRFFRENPEKRQAEVFLLTTADTLRLPAMQQAMAKYQPALSYWLLSNHEGSVDLYKKRGQGRQHVKTFELPPSHLWGKKAAAHHKKKEEEEPQKGLHQTFHYLLFPTPSKVKASLSAGGKVYVVTTEHALMCKAREHPTYWEMLFDNLPRTADHFEIGLMESGQVVLLTFSSQNKKGFLLDIKSGEKTEFVFNDWNPRIHKGFVFYEDRFCCPGRGVTTCWSIQEEFPLEIRGITSKLNIMLEEKNSQAEALRQNLPFSGKVLKNINRIWINETNSLVFNNQELFLGNNNFFMETRGGNNKIRCEAIAKVKNNFAFPDRSQVIVHPAGMLILVSSNTKIPAIFLPSVVEKALCLTTGKIFSGDENFINPAVRPKRLDAFSFNQQFLDPFVQHIVQ